MLSVVGHPTAVNPDYPPAQHGPAARLADPGSAVRQSMREREPKIPARPGAAQQGGRPGRLHRHRLGPAHPVLRRGPPARGPADRDARDLSQAADRGAGQPGRGDPLRDQPPAGDGAAVRAAEAGDEGHHRDRRHLAAAAADGARPTCARPSSRSCSSCSPPTASTTSTSSSPTRCTAHDRGGDEADGRHEDLQRLLPRPLLQPRRRGPRRHGGPRQDRARRAGRDQPARRRERPAHLREHQPRADGRRPQVGGVGLCGYESLRPHHNPKTIRDSDSYMDPKRVGAQHQGRAAWARWSTST